MSLKLPTIKKYDRWYTVTDYFRPVFCFDKKEQAEEFIMDIILLYEKWGFSIEREDKNNP